MYFQVTRRNAGWVTVGALSFAGFLILYWQKKKRQRTIQDELKGTRSNQQGKESKSPAISHQGVSETLVLPILSGKKDGQGDAQAENKNTKTLLNDDEPGTTNSVRTSSKKSQERSISFEMRISRDVGGWLIGKGGANIRKIQSDTKTRIMARGEVLENGDKIYTITGTPDAVGLAESKIRKHIMSLPVQTQSEMEVPEHSIGRIIGRQGENIHLIQDVSLCRVEIPNPSSSLQGGKLFTDDDYEAPRPNGNMRKIILKGTEEQMSTARKLINDAVEEDRTMRARVLESTSSRTNRNQRKSTAPMTPENSERSNATVVPVSKNDTSLPPLRPDKTMEVFVSCVYHPNEFYFQSVNQDTIDLDKLCSTMTEYYKKTSKQNEQTNFQIGNIVAAKFIDDKIYRAKILSLDKDSAEIFYVDYGDMRRCKLSDLRKIKAEFLRLRFQAILATLNLECLEGRWSDEAIDATVNLTKCATWQRMKAKVLGYLKDPSDETRDIIWLEMYDEEEKNIADSLIRTGLAGIKIDQPIPSIMIAPIVDVTEQKIM